MISEHNHKNCDALCKAKESMPDTSLLYDVAELFRVFGDSTRIRILYILMQDELCVCQIADGLDMTVSAVSHQLRVLKSSNLVKFRREGKAIYYSLADEHVRRILDQGMEHIGE